MSLYYRKICIDILSFEDNKLTGIIPPEIGNLRVLTELYLGYNEFKVDDNKTFPNVINIVTLQVLNLNSALKGYNTDSFEIPTELGNLIDLRTLDLANNYIASSSIPYFYGNMKSLGEFSIYLSWN